MDSKLVLCSLAPLILLFTRVGLKHNIKRNIKNMHILHLIHSSLVTYLTTSIKSIASMSAKLAFMTRFKKIKSHQCDHCNSEKSFKTNRIHNRLLWFSIVFCAKKINAQLLRAAEKYNFIGLTCYWDQSKIAPYM